MALNTRQNKKKSRQKINGKNKIAVEEQTFIQKVREYPHKERLGIIFTLVILLTLILSPSIKPRYRPLKIGDISPVNIKSGEDLLVEDKILTNKKRMRVVKDLQAVYDLDFKVISDINARLADAFMIMNGAYTIRQPELTGEVEVEVKEIYGRPQGKQREKVKDELKEHYLFIESSPLFYDCEKRFIKKVGLKLRSEDIELLRTYHYDAAIRDSIMRLVRNVMKKGIVSNRDLLNIEKDRGIIIRDIMSGNERNVIDVTPIYDIEMARKTLLKSNVSLPFKGSEKLKRLIIDVSAKLIRPNLTFNKQETELRKQKAADNVKPVYFHIKAGEMIVREGEKVSEEHLIKLEALSKHRTRADRFLSILGTFTLIIVLLSFLWFYLERFKASVIHDYQNIIILALILVLNLLLIRVSVFVSGAFAGQFGEMVSPATFHYAIPFTFGAILVSILFDLELTIIYSIMVSLFAGLIFRDGFGFTLMAFLGGLVSAFKTNHYKHRSDILKTGLLIGLINISVVVPLDILGNKSDAVTGLFNIIAGFSGGMFAGILVSGVLPLFESLFQLTTDIKLLEMANINHPVLKQLVVHAPGTYHHSIIVGTLAESAAESIDSNSLFARVCSYYHDIGKIKKPDYFIENQQDNINRHDNLSPSMSGLILMSHVKDGVDLAYEYKLPRKIVDIIQQHHGTGLINYFFQKAKEKETHQKVNEADYRYPGPKPQTKEAAIVMLADAVEASSKVLEDPTPARLEGLVSTTVTRIFTDGQLDECELTLKDLNKISESFVRILGGIFHHRIDYPQSKEEDGRRGAQINEYTVKNRAEKGRVRASSDRAGSEKNPGDIRVK